MGGNVMRARGLAAARRGAFAPALWGLLDQACVSLFNFITVFVVSRYLDRSEFGRYTLGYAALLYLNGLQIALLGTPHNIIGPRLEGQKYRRFTMATVSTQV